MNKEASLNSELKGKWVILLGESIIASGEDVKKLLEEAKALHPTGKFVLAKVPEEGTHIY